MLFRKIPRIAIALAVPWAAATSARADGLYLGGALGAPDVHGSVGGSQSDSGGFGLKVYGGWQFHPNFALEGSLFSLGHVDNANGHVETRGAALDAVARYGFAPGWSLYGSGGLAQARFSTSYGNDWSSGLKLGAGLQYDLTRSTAVRLGYERYHFLNASDGAANVGMTSVGVKFAF